MLVAKNMAARGRGLFFQYEHIGIFIEKFSPKLLAGFQNNNDPWVILYQTVRAMLDHAPY